ncbi:MAG: hypothetical protein CL626_06495 [Aurantimonas sp.]|nr:hypothetical protein [Aurantimonas sp.]|tara:strand:+ start:154 stop:1071 length:918 start_codon:yes stop_codon:yes gene_type:complete
MFQKHAFKKIALILLVLTFAAQAQEEILPDQSRLNRKQGLADIIANPILVEIVEDEAAADRRERREKEAAQRDKDELLAQQDMNTATQSMNVATQKMAIYSGVSTMLVAVGTALLFWTLRLTRQANKAALQVVEVTREMGQRQLRAYLQIRVQCPHAIIEGRRRGDGGPQIDGFGASLSAANSGGTPALDFCFSVRSVAVLDGREIWPETALLVDRQSNSGFVIHHEPVGFNLSMRPAPMLQALTDEQRKQAIVTVTVECTYQDVFGVKHHADLRFEGALNSMMDMRQVYRNETSEPAIQTRTFS